MSRSLVSRYGGHRLWPLFILWDRKMCLYIHRQVRSIRWKLQRKEILRTALTGSHLERGRTCRFPTIVRDYVLMKNLSSIYGREVWAFHETWHFQSCQVLCLREVFLICHIWCPFLRDEQTKCLTVTKYVCFPFSALPTAVIKVICNLYPMDISSDFLQNYIYYKKCRP